MKGSTLVSRCSICTQDLETPRVYIRNKKEMWDSSNFEKINLSVIINLSVGSSVEG